MSSEIANDDFGHPGESETRLGTGQRGKGEPLVAICLMTLGLLKRRHEPGRLVRTRNDKMKEIVIPTTRVYYDETCVEAQRDAQSKEINSSRTADHGG
jgi:hypothetical protein